MEKREISLRKNQRSAEVYSDTHAEYVLPDYLGEIRKILATGAEVRPAEKYSSDGVTEAPGIVVYDVLYTDSEGRLSGVSFTSDYDLSLPHAKDGADSLHLDSRIVSFAVRPAGPRKLSAKATVAAQTTSSYSEDATPEGTAFEEGREPEISTKEIKLLSAAESECVERELAESILRLDGSVADEVSVISSRAEAECESVGISDGEACVKGCVTVYAIIKNEDSEPYAITYKMPFNETVQCPDFSVGEPLGLVTVSSLNTAVSADDEGCEIVANVILDISVRSLGNELMTVVTDAYLCDYESENTYGKLNYTELLLAAREKINHTARLSRTDESILGLDEVLSLSATPRISCTVSGDELYLSGVIKYAGAATCVADSGERSYMPLKFEVPVEKTVALPRAVSDSARLDVRTSAQRPSMSFDSECAYVTSTLDIAFAASEDKSVAVLESSMAKEARESVGATVTVYYPEPSDTLFSVAKSHHTKIAKLARDNALSEAVMAGDGSGTLAGVKKLIIY